MIGEKITALRKTKKYTQEELAELAKVNLRTIQRIENNENTPRGKTLDLICNVLEIDRKELVTNNSTKNKTLENILVKGFFLIIFNLLLMSIIGYLTLDSNANLNSRTGAFLLSIFLPFCIVVFTQKMSGVERMLKFGTGFFIYIALVFFKHGFPTGIVTGLFPCLFLALSVLYFGNQFIKPLFKKEN